MSIKNSVLLLFVCSLIFVLPGCSGKKETKPNILLITIDTLRRDYLGFYGFPLETSPFIDQLAKGGVVFKNTITPLPLTDPSHASILSSLHPLTHELIRNAVKLPKHIETIAEVLQANGYYTTGTVAAAILAGKYRFSKGFDSFSDTWDTEAGHNMTWQRTAESVNESLFKQVEEYRQKHNDKPLFMWVHYYDPHSPYINWKDIVFKKKVPKTIHHKYAKEIRHTDDHIRDLYRFLAEKGISQKMITCITADHGEQLRDHGHTAVHWDIYSENTFVPLIFNGYNIPRDKVVEDYVSTMDIAVTLLGMVNLEFTTPGVHGINLLDASKNPKPVPKRDFLVIGNPMYVRSIQLIADASAYILNFDFLYKYWHVGPVAGVGSETDFPEARLKKVPDDAVHKKHYKKSGKYGLDVSYPDKLRKGLHFGVFRFDVKNDKGLSFGYKTGPGLVKTISTLNDKTDKTVTAYFPITPLDTLTGVIQNKKETEITNLRYAILPEAEFLTYSLSKQAVENDIFKNLKSLRKNKPGDELYFLDTDMAMKRNVLTLGGNRQKAVEGKKKIYRFLEFYRRAKKRFPGKSGRAKPLTEKEKDMLKSLGYL
ncbi:MAG: sulfatase [bacterium]|nr:sulfatase [bacterium]